MKNIIKRAFVVFMLMSVVIPQASFAFTIKQLDNVPVENDFILGPGKIELFLAPGETAVRDLTITNRTGKSLDISVNVEDFTGDAKDSSKLLGSEKGPYSLRDFILPEKSNFVLSHGERATLPVKINIPANAEPGGLYGAAILNAKSSAVANKEQVGSAKGQVDVISRLAELFFVRIKGTTTESGKLNSFSTDKNFYSGSPVNFNIDFSNSGKVHLNPYAEIEIKNFLGKKIDNIEIAPWFVMPGFNRSRSYVWDKGFTFGYYSAHLKLHRGYGDIIDEATTKFFIIPTRILLITLIVIAFVSVLLWFISTKFELKRKNND